MFASHRLTAARTFDGAFSLYRNYALKDILNEIFLCLVSANTSPGLGNNAANGGASIGSGGGYQDAVHITAILGESVVFNCQVEFPEGHPVPYVLQWEKKVGDTVRSCFHVSFSTLCSLLRGVVGILGALVEPLRRFGHVLTGNLSGGGLNNLNTQKIYMLFIFLKTFLN